MLPGGPLSWDDLLPIAARIAPLGWHVQLQMDGRLLPEREAMLRAVPCTLLIDHVGKFLKPVTPDHTAFVSLLRLLESGRCWLKLAAAYEVSEAGAPHYEDVGALARAAIQAAPERMIWASNWPHVGVEAAPDDQALLDLLPAWAGEDAICRQILVRNPEHLFGFGHDKQQEPEGGSS
jgi:D-galactarolactone isomerase